MLKRSFLIRPGARWPSSRAGSPPMHGRRAQRTFVASTASDANACSLAYPMPLVRASRSRRRFRAAKSSSSTRRATVRRRSRKPVSIIAPPGIYAGISVFSGIGLAVNAGRGNVTLRGLTINSVDPAATVGISFVSGAALYVDNVTVSNFPTAGPLRERRRERKRVRHPLDVPRQRHRRRLRDVRRER